MAIKVLKVVLTIILALAVIAAFIIIGELNDTALAPVIIHIEYDVPEDIDDPDALLYIAQTPPEIPESPEPEEEPENEPEDEPLPEPEEVFEDPGYVIIQMESSDINRGHLVLVNHENAFVFPQDHENDLIRISDHITESVGITTEHTILSASIITPLNDMMDAFHEHTNITNVVIRSAFRSMSGQQQIFDNMVRRWGRTGALRWAARPGHSEHHTGFAFDFGLKVSGQIEMFEGAGSYNWIPRNSHNYGFILRYPSGKVNITQTNFEPWHYRYVGIPHAPIIRSKNWALEEYIENIREYTFEEPLTFTFNDIEYQVYFTSAMEVRLPYDVDFNISGNNIDGFIVTFWESLDLEDCDFDGEA